MRLKRWAMAAILLSGLASGSAWGDEIAVGRFSSGDLTGWEKKVFKGETAYQIASEEGRRVLQAEASGTASGLFKKIQAPASGYPLLSWSWKVAGIVEKGDESTKSGDDCAARVYVVFPGVVFFQTSGLAYIWANHLPQGQAVPNPYQPQRVFMIAVDSGPGQAGRWRSHERDIRADYRRFFGREPGPLGAVAVMTDADDTASQAQAWYGDIFLKTKTSP